MIARRRKPLRRRSCPTGHGPRHPRAREELGLDPDELGSPVKVGFELRGVRCGCRRSVIPYVFLTGTTALVVAIVLTAIALILVGGTVGRLSGAGVIKSSVRQLSVGAAAAAVTFIIGKLVGVNLG